MIQKQQDNRVGKKNAVTGCSATSTASAVSFSPFPSNTSPTTNERFRNSRVWWWKDSFLWFVLVVFFFVSVSVMDVPCVSVYVWEKRVRSIPPEEMSMYVCVRVCVLVVSSFWGKEEQGGVVLVRWFCWLSLMLLRKLAQAVIR